MKHELATVTRATRARTRANGAYRASILAARDAGATLQAIADAAGTDPAAVLRLIRRNRER